MSGNERLLPTDRLVEMAMRCAARERAARSEEDIVTAWYWLERYERIEDELDRRAEYAA